MAYLKVEKLRDLIVIKVGNDKEESMSIFMEHGKFSQEIQGDAMVITVEGEDFIDKEEVNE